MNRRVGLRECGLAVALSMAVGACSSPIPGATHEPTTGSGAPTVSTGPSSPTIAFTPSIGCGEGSSCQLVMDVQAPAGDGSWPLILLVPGGPQPLLEQPKLLVDTLAPALAREGAVVLTIQWRQGPQHSVSFPDNVADVACAIGIARSVGASYGADPATVIVVGHSLGGWAGAVLALTPSEYSPDAGACNATAGSLRPDRFVSIAGALNEATVVDDISMSAQLGIDPADAAAADPFALIDRYPPGMPITLIHGTADIDVLPDVSREFGSAAVAHGYTVDLIEVEGADHHSVLTAPETIATIMAVATAD
jgi:acetyl esterase/lipase